MPGPAQQCVFLQSLLLALHCFGDVTGAGSGAGVPAGPTGPLLGLMWLIQRLVETGGSWVPDAAGGCVTGGSGTRVLLVGAKGMSGGTVAMGDTNGGHAGGTVAGAAGLGPTGVTGAGSSGGCPGMASNLKPENLTLSPQVCVSTAQGPCPSEPFPSIQSMSPDFQ